MTQSSMLQPCPDCTSMASVNADCCAHCGAPLRRYRRVSQARDAADASGRWMRAIARFFTATFVGRTLLLTPLVGVCLLISATQDLSLSYEYGDDTPASAWSIQQAWRYHSFTGTLIPLDADESKFPPDVDFTLSDQMDPRLESVRPEFYAMFGRTMSAQYYEHLILLAVRLSREHEDFHRHGNAASISILFVAALEALLFGALASGLIVLFRGGPDANNA